MKKPTFKKLNFKPAKKLPSLERAKDPLKGIELSDNIEESPKQELTAVQAGFRERAQREAQRFEDATDSGYYTCLVFENRDQLNAFLDGIGMNGKNDLYLDGRVVAHAMGIDISNARTGGGGSQAKIDRKFADLVRE